MSTSSDPVFKALGLNDEPQLSTGWPPGPLGAPAGSMWPPAPAPAPAATPAAAGPLGGAAGAATGQLQGMNPGWQAVASAAAAAAAALQMTWGIAGPLPPHVTAAAEQAAWAAAAAAQLPQNSFAGPAPGYLPDAPGYLPHAQGGWAAPDARLAGGHALPTMTAATSSPPAAGAAQGTAQTHGSAAPADMTGDRDAAAASFGLAMATGEYDESKEEHARLDEAVNKLVCSDDSGESDGFGAHALKAASATVATAKAPGGRDEVVPSTPPSKGYQGQGDLAKATPAKVPLASGGYARAGAGSSSSRGECSMPPGLSPPGATSGNSVVSPVVLKLSSMSFSGAGGAQSQEPGGTALPRGHEAVADGSSHTPATAAGTEAGAFLLSLLRANPEGGGTNGDRAAKGGSRGPASKGAAHTTAAPPVGSATSSAAARRRHTARRGRRGGHGRLDTTAGYQ